MPIHLEKADCDPHCLKYLWSISNNRTFVTCLTRLALGQHHHALVVIRTLAPLEASKFYEKEINELIRILEQTQEGQVENRDGWLFQLVSWIALAVRTSTTTVITPPHPMESQKGFDGLALSLSDRRDKLDYLLITEDKATTSPRDVFRDEVLPGIERIETGELTSQIRSMAATLIGVAVSSEKDRESILQAALWLSLLRYRTCFATQKNSLPRRIELFDGYATAAPGAIDRRRGELLLVDDLRKWLGELAKQIVAELRTLKTI